MELLNTKLTRQDAVEKAESILNSPDPWKDIVIDIGRLGFGQDMQVASLIYLTATSRLIERPLWSIITGASGSGKSKIRSVISQCVPDCDRIDITEMTPQAMIRLPGTRDGGVDLKGKLFVKDERLHNAIDPGYLRSLYEDGVVSKLVTSGKTSVMLKLDGCPAWIETSTAVAVHDEDQNRRLVLAVNEGADKTNAVLNHIANSVSGQCVSSMKEIHLVHQELQSLLPRHVGIQVPFAFRMIKKEMTQQLNADSSRIFLQLLSATQTIALIRNNIRERTIDGGLIATVDDYATAYVLLDPIFRCRASDLSMQSSDLLRLIGARFDGVSDRIRQRGFSRNDLKEWSGLSKSTLERRLTDLVSRDLIHILRYGGQGVKHLYGVPQDWEHSLNGETIFAHPSDM